MVNRFCLVLGLLACTAVGCKDKPSTLAAVPSASASASAVASAASSVARPSRPTHPAPSPEVFSVASSDGVKVSVSLYSAGPANAPAVVLVHRLGGSQAEWLPLLERLLPSKTPMNLLTLDLRGHGESVHKVGSPQKLAWTAFHANDFAPSTNDVLAAVSFLEKRKGGPPSTLLLVGSDLGANAVVAASKTLGPRVGAVGLVSPGASLRGIELYQPFSAVLERPNWVATSRSDSVSAQPATALASMSHSTLLMQYDGRAHSAEYLGAEHKAFWDDLADWVDARVAAPPTPPGSASAQPAGSAPASPSASAAHP